MENFETVYNSDFLICMLNKESSVLLVQWKSKTREMNILSFQEEAEKIVFYVKKEGVKNVIGDSTDLKVMLTPDIQEKLDQGIIRNFNNVIDKFAHIYNEDFIKQLSVEQLFDENEDRTYKEKFVTSLEEAIKWISGETDK